MVKYKPRDFGNAIFDLSALYGPIDTSQQQSRDHKKGSLNYKNIQNLI